MPCASRFRLRLVLAVVAAAGSLAPPALAGGGTLAFQGGTKAQQAQVRAALEASTFDWNVLPQIAVHIGDTGSYAVPGHVYLDASLLDAGRFSWGVVQHEFGHQVDFLLLRPADREELAAALRADTWCYSIRALQHALYGCERFASVLAWAYWQSADNCIAPQGPDDEAAAMAPADFRRLVSRLLGVREPAAGEPRRRGAPLRRR